MLAKILSTLPVSRHKYTPRTSVKPHDDSMQMLFGFLKTNTKINEEVKRGRWNCCLAVMNRVYKKIVLVEETKGVKG